MTVDDFLRLCLRQRWHRDSDAELRAAVQTLDADSTVLLQRIASERIGPLLHRAVGERDILPADVRAALQQTHRVVTLQNMLLFHEMGRCLQALAQARLAVIVLKGAALAQTVYGHPGLRQMCDLDLLVDRGDFRAVRQVLEELGYVPLRRETHPGVIEEHENEMAFRKPGRHPAPVDVHWSLFDSPYYQRSIPMDWFWQSAETAEISGVPSRILGSEALIIHLCGHLVLHHQANGLMWWHDIAEVLSAERERIDWNELLARTQAYELILPVREVLRPLARDWKVAVPPEVLRRLGELRPSANEERLFERHSSAQPAGQRFWSDLRALPDWRQRLRFARTNLFPSVQYMRERYRISHPLLLPIYYPYRWCRGLLGRE